MVNRKLIFSFASIFEKFYFYLLSKSFDLIVVFFLIILYCLPFSFSFRNIHFLSISLFSSLSFALLRFVLPCRLFHIFHFISSFFIFFLIYIIFFLSSSFISITISNVGTLLSADTYSFLDTRDFQAPDCHMVYSIIRLFSDHTDHDMILRYFKKKY